MTIFIVIIIVAAKTGELVEQSHYVYTEKPACLLLGLPGLGADRFFLPLPIASPRELAGFFPVSSQRKRCDMVPLPQHAYTFGPADPTPIDSI